MAVLSNKFNMLRGDSLKARSARGMMKLGIGTGVERFMRLVRMMILTRILAPDQFGLMSIILVSVSVFEQLAEVGIKLAVVQNKRGTTQEFLNATWWFQVVRSLLLFAVAMLAAPLVCSILDKPYMLNLLRVSLLAIVFRGFVSPRAYTLQKEYKFGLMTLYIQGSALCGTVATIVCAFVLKNVWALVIGNVSEYFAMCMLSYIITPLKPKFSIDRDSLKELMTFARGMFGMPIISLIGGITPVFVLGRLVTDDALGLYAMAYRLAGIPLMLFNKAISPVIFPGLVKKQDNKESLCNMVIKTTKILAAATIPLVVYMAVCASGLLLILWGPQYVDVTIPFVLFCSLVIVKPQAIVVSSTYVSVGKPYLQRRFVIIMTSIIVIFIYPAIINFGLTGAAATIVLSNYIAMFLQIFWCRRAIPLKFDDYIKCYIPGLLMAFPSAITVFILNLSGINSLPLILIAGLMVLFIVYLIYFGRYFFSWNQRSTIATDKQTKMDMCDVLHVN